MSDEEEDQYEVDKILKIAETADGKAILYHVSWKGYDSSENTWQDEKSLENCQQAIKDFLAATTDGGRQIYLKHHPEKKAEVENLIKNLIKKTKRVKVSAKESPPVRPKTARKVRNINDDDDDSDNDEDYEKSDDSFLFSQSMEIPKPKAFSNLLTESDSDDFNDIFNNEKKNSKESQETSLLNVLKSTSTKQAEKKKPTTSFGGSVPMPIFSHETKPEKSFTRAPFSEILKNTKSPSAAKNANITTTEPKKAEETKQKEKTKTTKEAKTKKETKTSKETKQKEETKASKGTKQKEETKTSKETKQKEETKASKGTKQKEETKTSKETKQKEETKTSKGTKQKEETKAKSSSSSKEKKTETTKETEVSKKKAETTKKETKSTAAKEKKTQQVTKVPEASKKKEEKPVSAAVKPNQSKTNVEKSDSSSDSAVGWFSISSSSSSSDIENISLLPNSSAAKNSTETTKVQQASKPQEKLSMPPPPPVPKALPLVMPINITHDQDIPSTPISSMSNILKTKKSLLDRGEILEKEDSLFFVEMDVKEFYKPIDDDRIFDKSVQCSVLPRGLSGFEVQKVLGIEKRENGIFVSFVRPDKSETEEQEISFARYLFPAFLADALFDEVV